MDRTALRERYRAERDKRLRPDGNDQYVEPTGRFAHFLDDPYVQPAARRRLGPQVGWGKGNRTCNRPLAGGWDPSEEARRHGKKSRTSTQGAPRMSRPIRQG